jgi:GAF domain-containing protein
VPDSWLGAREDSLRRIAALVAGGAASADVFAAIVREVGYVVGVSMVVVCRYDPGRATATVIGAWSEFPHPFQAGTRWPLDGPTLLFQVLKSGRPARIDDFTGIPGTIADAGRKAGFGAAAGAPIIVDGEVWGAMMVNAGRGPVPDRMEERLTAFTELLGTAISNTESRVALARLAEEQAALRRVATLVARGVAAEEVFAAVAEEVGRLLPVEYAGLSRYEPDGALSMVARSGRGLDHIPVGSRWTLGGKNVATVVFETGRPARIDSYADLSDPGAATAFREVGVRSAVGTPIVVDGRLWGVMIAGTTAEQPLPADTEARLASFTELLATAIANAESRAGLARLAEEQAALRRVATLVARGTRPERVFAAVANEVGRLLSVDLANVIRYESDDTVTLVASAGGLFPVGSRWPLAGQSNLATLVSEAGHPARIDDYADATGALAEDIRKEGIRSAVGTPIIVEGRLWGLIIAGSSQEQPLPAATEARLGSFTELVATAIANTEARTEVGRLADEQTALRRVATLVAREAPPEQVFAAIADELVSLLGVEATRLFRYENDGTATVLAEGGDRDPRVPVGTKVTLGGHNVATLVFETQRSARIDNYTQATGPVAALARGLGFDCLVGAPIVVEGKLWGAIIAATRGPAALPADTELRIEEFTGLMATGISNIQARAELAASLARIVAASDDARRQVVRDLHDGAQQRLVHTIVTLKLAHMALRPNEEPGFELVAEALDHAQRANAELRDLARGILPAALTRGGLRAGVDALASRMPVPVDNRVAVGALPDAVEATAYFVVAEALTNVAKHARAQRAAVMARIEDGTLAVHVSDDGVGGARPDGSGLVGLADRLAVLGGRLRVETPPDGGTLVAAAIPLTD